MRHSMLLLLGTMSIATASAAPLPISYALEIGDHRPWALDAGSPGFDAEGTAYVRAGTDLSIVRPNGQVTHIDFQAAAKTAIDRDVFKGRAQWDGAMTTNFMVDTSVVFDTADRLYTLMIPRYSNLATAALLWSSDHGASWRAVALTGRAAAIERPDAFNDHSGPPTVISFETYGKYTGTKVWLDPLTITGGEVVKAGPSLLLSDRTLLIPNHSGAANSTFTTKDKIFIAYDTTDTSGPGTLSVMRQYDRTSGKLESDEIPIGRSTTAKGPDVHDIPAITMGPDGRPIIVIGAHHAQFLMFTANRPDTLLAGLTANGPIGQPSQDGKYGSYSYVSLNMSKAGTMNIIARAEGEQGLYQLVELNKPWHKPWTVWPNGLLHRVIAQPSRPDYAAWRQRVTVDHRGWLYLNFRFYANQLTPAEALETGLAGSATDYCGRGRCWYKNVPDIAPQTLVSDDDGQTWR